MNALELLTARHGDPATWAGSDFDALNNLNDTYGPHGHVDIDSDEATTPELTPAA